MALQWYVVHAYSNFEHKVKESLIERVESVAGCRLGNLGEKRLGITQQQGLQQQVEQQELQQAGAQQVCTGTCFSTVRQTMRQHVTVSWWGTQTATVRVAWKGTSFLTRTV